MWIHVAGFISPFTIFPVEFYLERIAMTVVGKLPWVIKFYKRIHFIHFDLIEKAVAIQQCWTHTNNILNMANYPVHHSSSRHINKRMNTMARVFYSIVNANAIELAIQLQIRSNCYVRSHSPVSLFHFSLNFKQ